VPDGSKGSCLDPGLPRSGLQAKVGQGEGEEEAGPGPPSGAGQDQMESSKDGENMMGDDSESI
jgi:hypothetical protein